MRSTRLLFSVLVLAFSLAGCAARVQNVTGLPAGVTQTEVQQWDTAVQNLNKISGAVSAARQSLIALHTGGLLPDGPAYVTALQVIGKIDTLEVSASAVLQQTPNNFSASTKAQVQALLQQISAQLLTLNSSGVTGIKNPNSQTQVADLIGEISAAVTLILSL